MKKNDDFLSEIECDIDRDWEDIQRSIEEKEKEKNILEKIEYLRDHPVRMNFPHFHKFYELMVELYESYYLKNELSNLSPILKEIFSRMFSRYGYCNENKMSPVFDYIWAMFCDPNIFVFHTMPCQYCNNKWDVIIDRRMNSPIRYDIRGDINATMMDRTTLQMVMCPSCGAAIGSINVNKVIGIFEHKEIKRQESNDLGFIRKYLEERGYDFR